MTLLVLWIPDSYKTLGNPYFSAFFTPKTDQYVGAKCGILLRQYYHGYGQYSRRHRCLRQRSPTALPPNVILLLLPPLQLHLPQVCLSSRRYVLLFTTNSSKGCGIMFILTYLIRASKSPALSDAINSLERTVAPTAAAASAAAFGHVRQVIFEVKVTMSNKPIESPTDTIC